LVWVALSGCDKDNEEKCAFVPETRNVQCRFENRIAGRFPAFHYHQNAIGFLLTHHRELRDPFLAGRVTPTIPYSSMNSSIASPIWPWTRYYWRRTRFRQRRGLKEQFRSALCNIKYYYPEFKRLKSKRYQRNGTDLVVSDTLIVIGLDYFLGPGAKYRPNMYHYMLRRYNRDFIVPSVMLLYGIDAGFNRTDLADKTVLADMIAYGKAYYFAKRNASLRARQRVHRLHE